MRLKNKIILLVCSVVTVCLLVTALWIAYLIKWEIQDGMAARALSVARIVARSPIVIKGLSGELDDAAIQKYATECKEAADVRFVVVFGMDGIRKSHPNPWRIGEHVAGGDEKGVLAGKEYTSFAEGTLGYSLRGFTPVYDYDGKQIGAVLVGVMVDRVDSAIKYSQFIIFIVTCIGIATGILGALMLAQNIKKTLLGLEPEEIAKHLEERSVMLQSVHEGILAVDSQGIITLVNDEARRILGMAGFRDDPVGKPANAVIPDSKLLEVVKSGEMKLDQEQDLLGITVLTNIAPLIVDGKIVGAIATFRDKSEVKRLAEELTGVKSYVEALRSKSHEFMNRLHVILGLVRLECYDQLATYINQIASGQQAEENYVCERIRDAVIAGFILSKLSLAREKKISMTVSESSFLPQVEREDIVHDLVTIIGNLVENAFEAVENSSRCEVSLHVAYDDGQLTIIVGDTGTGIPYGLGSKIFERGVSSKSAERGIGLYLVKHTVERLNGRVEYRSAECGTEFTVVIPCRLGGS